MQTSNSAEANFASQRQAPPCPLDYACVLTSRVLRSLGIPYHHLLTVKSEYVDNIRYPCNDPFLYFTRFVWNLMDTHRLIPYRMSLHKFKAIIIDEALTVTCCSHDGSATGTSLSYENVTCKKGTLRGKRKKPHRKKLKIARDEEPQLESATCTTAALSEKSPQSELDKQPFPEHSASDSGLSQGDAESASDPIREKRSKLELSESLSSNTSGQSDSDTETSVQQDNGLEMTETSSLHRGNSLADYIGGRRLIVAPEDNWSDLPDDHPWCIELIVREQLFQYIPLGGNVKITPHHIYNLLASGEVSDVYVAYRLLELLEPCDRCTENLRYYGVEGLMTIHYIYETGCVVFPEQYQTVLPMTRVVDCRVCSSSIYLSTALARCQQERPA